MKLINSFSLNMTGDIKSPVIFTREISKEEASKISSLESYVGHENTARVLSNLLGREIRPNRATLSLKEGEVILVAQYVGPRLPEGATTLPEGAQLRFILVSVVSTETLWNNWVSDGYPNIPIPNPDGSLGLNFNRIK